MGGMGMFSVSDSPPAAGGMGSNLTLIYGSGQTVLPRYDFLRSGHCLWAIIIGWLAGYFTRWVHSIS